MGSRPPSLFGPSSSRLLAVSLAYNVGNLPGGFGLVIPCWSGVGGGLSLLWVLVGLGSVVGQPVVGLVFFGFLWFWGFLWFSGRVVISYRVEVFLSCLFLYRFGQWDGSGRPCSTWVCRVGGRCCVWPHVDGLVCGGQRIGWEKRSCVRPTSGIRWGACGGCVPPRGACVMWSSWFGDAGGVADASPT